MELKDLTELLKKGKENPTDTILRVLGRFAEEHPEEVNKKLSSEEMDAEIRRLQKEASEKDELVQRLLSQLNENGRDTKKEVSTVVPTTVVPTAIVKATAKTKDSPKIYDRGTVKAQDLVDENTIQDLSLLSENDIEESMKKQEWAKTNSEMRSQVMKFIEEERKNKQQ